MPRQRFYFFLFILFLSTIFSSCASVPPNIQPQINHLLTANQAEGALRILEAQKKAYGKNNELLYLLDKAFVLHLARKYSDSIPCFEQAKQKFESMILAKT